MILGVASKVAEKATTHLPLLHAPDRVFQKPCLVSLFTLYESIGQRICYTLNNPISEYFTL